MIFLVAPNLIHAAPNNAAKFGPAYPAENPETLQLEIGRVYDFCSLITNFNTLSLSVVLHLVFEKFDGQLFDFFENFFARHLFQNSI